MAVRGGGGGPGSGVAALLAGRNDRLFDCQMPALRPPQTYLSCMQQHSATHHRCSEASKEYLECRMERGLMKREDLDSLGFAADRRVKESVHEKSADGDVRESRRAAVFPREAIAGPLTRSIPRRACIAPMVRAARERIAGLQAGDRIRKRKTIFGW